MQRLWRRLTLTAATPDEYDAVAAPFVEDDTLRLQLACVLVRHAQHAATPEHRLTASALRALEFYHTTPVKLLRHLNVAAYIAIAAFETPGWCVAPSGHLLPACANPETYARYATYGITPLSPAAATGLECVCILLFVLQLTTKLYIMGLGRFVRTRWPLLQGALLVLAIVDLGFTASPVLWRRTPISRPLRALFVVFSHRKLRDTLTSVVLMLPRILEFSCVLLTFVIFSAWLGYLLLSPWEPAASGSFGTFSLSFYNMFLLLTATNFPDVALPAYRVRRASMLFFVSYQLVCAFAGLSLMLALVFRSYCAHMRSEAARLAENRRRALRAAFEQLAGHSVPALNLSALPFERFAPLLARLRPDLLPEQVGICFEGLDHNQRGRIEPREFEGVLCALRVYFDDTAPSRMHRHRHATRRVLRRLLADWRITLITDGLVILNALVVAEVPAPSDPVAPNASLAVATDAADWLLGGDGGGSCAAVLGSELPFVVLWTAETCLKLYSFGPLRLVGWNVFDVALTATTLVALLALAADGCDARSSALQLIRAALLLRLLRLLRLLALSPRFRILLAALRASARAALQFVSLLGISLFFFAAVGVELLGGKWYDGAECLEGTKYARLDYSVNHFNDFPSAFATCWELLCINNYKVFMDAGYACADATSNSFFFGSFYLYFFFLLMNLLTSFILQSVSAALDSTDAATQKPIAVDGGAYPPPSAATAALDAATLRPQQVWNADEAEVASAEGFARACMDRLRAEGNNTSIVTVHPEQGDGYSALVRLLAGRGNGGPTQQLLGSLTSIGSGSAQAATVAARIRPTTSTLTPLRLAAPPGSRLK